MKTRLFQLTGKLLLALFISFSSIQAGHAFTYVMMHDGDLLAHSELVASGEVIKANQLTNQQGTMFATEYLVEVSDTIKGQSVATVLVRVPGAQQPGPDRIYLHSAPHFFVTDQVLLFLNRHDDGYYQPSQYALGAFAIKQWNDKLYAVRNLYGADLSSARKNAYAEPSNVRELGPFKAWLKSKLAPKTKIPARTRHNQASGNKTASENYYVTDPLLKSRLSGLLTEPFTLVSSGGTGFRWTVFDLGKSVIWRHNGGTNYTTQIKQALAAWNNAAGSNISMHLEGSTTAKEGLLGTDGVNTILFGDPNNEIGGSYICGVGGTLGIGGPFSSGVHTYNGETFNTTVEGDLVINDRAECFLNDFNKANAAEIIGHELGHTLGFGHSCGDASSGPCDNSPAGDNDALMRATARDNGRGATLGSDDILAAAHLYRSTSVAANRPPTISTIENQVIDRDSSTGAIHFTITDPDGDINAATLTASSNNPDLVAVTNIRFTGFGNDRSISIVPNPGTTGSATITVTVTDENKNTKSTRFSLTVNQVANNEPPTISHLADQTITQGSSVGPLGFTVADPDNETTSLTVTASSDNPLLIPIQNIQLGGSGSERTVTLFPLESAKGIGKITITVSDGQDSASTSFKLTVVAPNIPPTISAIADQIVAINSSTGALAFAVQDPDGDDQSLLIRTDSDNPNLIPNRNILLSGTGPDCTVTVIPVKNVTGIVNITITVSDRESSAATTFAVIIEGSTKTDNTGDSGVGSLRYAIINAADGDAISFDRTVFPQDRDPDNNPTIQLDSPLVIEKEITIDGDINGDGIPDVTILGSDTGLMQITSAGKVNIGGLILAESSAVRGGALSVTGGGTINIEHSVIKHNTAESGGAIFNDSGLVKIADSVLFDNVSEQGGGIVLEGPAAQMTIEQSVFDRNASLGNGGAILNTGGTLQLSNSTFSGNSSGLNGGAIFNTSGGQVSINNVTIAENTARFGAGLAQQSGNTNITNSIITDNGLPGSSGFSAFADDDTVDVAATGGEITVSFSGIKKFYGNINDSVSNRLATDMMLEPASIVGIKKIYRLQPGSPAIDAGDNNIPGQGGTCSPVDIVGKPRPIDGDGDFIAICDMGAFEYDVVSDTGYSADLVARIQEQYIAFYGRPGDPDGVRFWVGELEKAGSLSAIQNQFGTSAEFSELIVPGNATTVDQLTREQKAELINNLYLNMFGRNVEGSADDPTTGLGFWIAELDKPEVSLIDISTRIADGAINDDDTILRLRVRLAQRITEEFVLQSKDYTQAHIAAVRNFIFDGIDETSDDPAELDVKSLVSGL